MKLADMHCDTISLILEKRRAGEEASLRKNNLHVDLERMKKSGYLVQNFALFVDKEACEDPWQEALELLGVYEEELEKNRDLIAPAKRFADMEENAAKGKMSALLTVEEGAVCCGELQKLGVLYEKGVRMLTLTWNYPNELGAPNLNRELGKKAWGANRALRESRLEGEAYVEEQRRADMLLKAALNTPDTERGLTERGREFVTRMEELGMIPDVSHLSDAGFYDVLETAKKPFVASHSNARSICPCARNLTDDMLKKLAERGGVTGLNFCADFLAEASAGQPNPGTVEAVVRHARHIVDMGGIECLGLGSDFDGIDTHAELSGVQAMGVLWEALEGDGFLPSQIDKIFGGNVMRLYRETLK